MPENQGFRTVFLGGGDKDRMVYGMYTASLYSMLVGVYLPGERRLFHECDIHFCAPVYIGDVLTVRGSVKEIDPRFSRIVLKAEIRNQDEVNFNVSGGDYM